jgi:hypothetical protein
MDVYNGLIYNKNFDLFLKWSAGFSGRGVVGRSLECDEVWAK